MKEMMGEEISMDDINISMIEESETNVTSDSRDERLAIFEIATSGLIFLLIVFGNSCVLIALAMRKLKMNRMYYFLLHLCVADLITAFFNVLPQLAWDVTYRFYGGNVLCKLIKYLQILGPYLSSYVLVMTAIDRYQAICFPMSNCTWTPRRSQLMVHFAWTFSLFFCTPQIFIFSYKIVPGLSPDVYDCWGSFPEPFGERIYVTWYAVTVFIVPFVILTFTHVCICRKIWKNVHQKRKSFKAERNRINERIYRHKHHTEQISPSSSTSDSLARSTNLLVTVGRSYRFKGRGRIEVTVEGETRGTTHTYNPRSHTISGLSRAKIKTVKITVVVILCYVCCSSPFICVQLWASWVPGAHQSPLWSGPLIAILMLMPSLNSCVNPWIYLFFNKNLVKTLKETCCRRHCRHKLPYLYTGGGEFTSNYDTKYSSQTENDIVSSTMMMPRNSSRSNTPTISIPTMGSTINQNNCSLINNNLLTPNGVCQRNGNLTVEHYQLRRKLSNGSEASYCSNSTIISQAIEMQNLCAKTSKD